MNILQRLHELRSYFVGGLVSSDKAAAVALNARAPSYSKIYVDEDIALNYSAFWAAVNLLAGDVSTTPCSLMKRRASGPGKDVYDDHQIHELLHDQPNPEMSIVDFLEAAMAHAVTWGNAYAEIERDRLDRPVALWPVTPNRVQPYRERNLSTGKYGVLQYVVDGRGPALDLKSMWHLHGLGWDGTCGYSVVTRAREAIGLGLAEEKFGATYFGSGSTVGGVITTTADINKDQADDIRTAIEQMHQSTDKAHRFLVIPGGQRFDKIGIPPNDAQFLESRKFQVTEMARWFGVPPHKIGDLEKATFTNIEQQDLDYYKRSLRRWYVRIEKESGRKLIASNQRFVQFFKFNADAFLRGDIASRYTALGTARDKGVINANEWRDLEDMNPQPGTQGDIYTVQQAMVPLDRLTDMADALIAKNEAVATKDDAIANAPPAAASASPAPPADPNAAEGRARTAEAAAIAAEERAKDLERDLRIASAKSDRDDEDLRQKTTALKDATDQAATLRALSDDMRTRMDAVAEHQADLEALAADAQRALAEATRLRAEAEQLRSAEREAIECEQAARALGVELNARLAEMEARALRDAARITEFERDPQRAADARLLTQAREASAELQRAADLAATELATVRASAAAAGDRATAAETTAERMTTEHASVLRALEAEHATEMVEATTRARAAEDAAIEARNRAAATNDDLRAAVEARTGAEQALRLVVSQAADQAVARAEAVTRARASEDAAIEARNRAAAMNDDLRAAVEARTAAERARETAERGLERVEADRELALRLREAELRRDVDAAMARVEAATALSVEARESVEVLRADNRAGTQALLDAQTARDDARRDALLAAGERDRALTAEAEAQRQLDVERDRLREADRVRDAYDRRVEETTRTLTALREQLTAAEQARQAATEEAGVQIAAREAEASERERITASEKRHLGVLITAHRTVARDVTRRLLDREISGLQRAQMSVDKLRQRLDTFYQGHEAVLANALAAVVCVHLAAVRSEDNPVDVSTALAHAHVARSRAELQAVLDGDASQFAGNLNALLVRWAEHRADELPDFLMQREVEAARGVALASLLPLIAQPVAKPRKIKKIATRNGDGSWSITEEEIAE